MTESAPETEFSDGVGSVVDFVLRSLLVPALLLDGGGLVERASPAALADLHQAPDLLVGQPVGQALGIDPGELESFPGAPTTQTRTSAVGGRSLRWRSTPLADLRVDGGWLIEFAFEDIEGTEDQLRARTDRIEDVLHDLTDRFDSVNRYVSLISHDLQAPTRRLLSFVELVRRESAAGLDVNGRLDAIERGARHLLHLTSELLAYAQLGRTPFELEPVDAGEVLTATLEQLDLVLTDSGATVLVPEPLPMVTASPTFLSLVFQHLIENAVRYQRPGVAPEIEIRWTTVEDEIRVDVIDNGVGIPDDGLVTVFEPFRRLAATDDARSGLGLATVGELVDRFGGSIFVSESTVGVGSTFTIMLRREAD